MTDNQAANDGEPDDDSVSSSRYADGEPMKVDEPGDAPVDEVETLRSEAQENWNKYLRTVAELDNLRKRSARDLENARKFGAEKLVAGILPVRDSMEAALNAAAEANPESIDIGTLIEGERATLRLLDQALQAVGLEEIDPEGEPFDPERHEAMSMQPSDTAEPNSVLAVVQKGYALNGRIVRPARVIVARAPA